MAAALKIFAVLSGAGAILTGWKWAGEPSAIPKETRNAVIGLGVIAAALFLISRKK